MSTADYGTYRLSYTPPASTGNEYYPNITIEMSTSGEATVEQMLRFYEAFLAASGYVLKGEIQVVEPETDPWDGYFNSTARGSQATDFVPFSSFGGDVISFK